ncbi:hypothetical protein A5680_07440 [Mycobacterium sp. E2989]|nr:hypothetical protein A5702_23150 [Mycobacterium sp. E3339]OBH85366.1 hypothetical protein A5680_07440 [Mycobacterium sp. E2989]
MRLTKGVRRLWGYLLLTDSDVDALASEFLQSHYLGPIYADWSPDRRLDTFLRRRGLSRVADDGDLSNTVLERVLGRRRS